MDNPAIYLWIPIIVVSFLSIVKMINKGKKNEIRRIFKFLDLNLLSLKRVRIGEIKLSNLAIGSWRPLTKKELSFLIKIQS